jgi:hypothetical protein
VQRIRLSSKKLDVRIFVRLKKHVVAKVEEEVAIEATKAMNSIV